MARYNKPSFIDPSNFEIYRLTDKSEKAIWDDCIFVFDACALLDFYLLPLKTRTSIFEEIFKAKMKNRLWIPNHVEFEYLKNRESVIGKPIKEKYEPLNIEVFSHLKKNIDDSLNRLKMLKERTEKDDTHPHFDIKFIMELEAALNNYTIAHDKFKKEFDKKVESVTKEISELKSNDTILKNFRIYFQKGKYYSFDEIMKICEEGGERYSMTIPPGYMDLHGKDPKEGTQIYGDLIVWKQILEYAKEKKTNIVFVTNDVTKGDWCIWDSRNNKVISPRQELIKEFFDITNKRFWIYSLNEFMYKSNKLLETKVPDDQIKQALKIITFDKMHLLIEGEKLYVNLRANESQKINLVHPINIHDAILSFDYSPMYDKKLLHLTFYSQKQSLITVSIFLDKNGHTSFQLDDEEDMLNQTFVAFELECKTSITTLCIGIEKLRGGYI